MAHSEKTEKLAFEEALKRLEDLVESMEEGEVPLAESVAKFEEGDKLIQHCAQLLKNAELKIQKLKKNKNLPVLEELEEPVTD